MNSAVNLASISAAFQKYRSSTTAKRINNYPSHLKNLVFKAFKDGISLEELKEHTNLSHQTLLVWKNDARLAQFTKVAIISKEEISGNEDRSIDSPTDGAEAAMFYLKNGVKFTIPLHLLDANILKRMGVL